MTTILITHPIPGNTADILEKAGMSVICDKRDAYSQKELIKLIKKHKPDALVSFLTDSITKEVMMAHPGLKIISNYAVGFNNIDIEAAKQAKIAVANTPISGYSVAEFTASLAVSLLRKITEAHMYTVKGKYKGWNPNIFIGDSLQGKTLGIIGSGHIGSEAAKILHRGFDVKIVYSDIAPNERIEKELGARRVETNELFKIADVVSLHVALNESTKHLVNAQRLLSMKKNAVLINTSRGPVIDEKALVTALSKKIISGAALDVYEFEPKISAKLLKMPHVILTPHIASATREARDDMARIVAQNVIDHLEGKKPQGAVFIP